MHTRQRMTARMTATDLVLMLYAVMVGGMVALAVWQIV